VCSVLDLRGKMVRASQRLFSNVSCAQRPRILFARGDPFATCIIAGSGVHVPGVRMNSDIIIMAQTASFLNCSDLIDSRLQTSFITIRPDQCTGVGFVICNNRAGSLAGANVRVSCQCPPHSFVLGHVPNILVIFHARFDLRLGKAVNLSNVAII